MRQQKREEVIARFRACFGGIGSIDFPSVEEVEDVIIKHGISPLFVAQACRYILEEPRYGRLHGLAILCLRQLGVYQRLSSRSAQTLLESIPITPHALVESEDGYTLNRNIEAVLASPRLLPTVLTFIDSCLLEEHSIRDWRWEAFICAGLIIEKYGAASIPFALAEKFRKEADLEEDPSRRRQMQWMVSEDRMSSVRI